MKILGLLFFCLPLFPVILWSEESPRLSGIWSDGIVLQRDRPIVVRGFGAGAGNQLELQLGEQRWKSQANANGEWVVTIPAQPASDIGVSLSLKQDAKVIQEVKDILFGDVWLAAGQSNMQWQVKGMIKGLPETKDWADAVHLPYVRYRRVNDPVLTDRKKRAAELQSGEWKKLTAENVLQFSAVAAVFAESIAEEVSVPIGIIDVSWGGKPIEPFIPRENFETSLLKQIRDLADADRLEELQNLPGGVIIRNPEGYPGSIYHARMAPLNSFPVKGFLWYQGESNAGKGEDPREYRHKMRALVSGWRQDWQDDQLPIYFVQLPSFEPATGWIRMREEQRLASLSIPNSAMAVTIDLPGEDIHPPHKIEVGKRLARLALKKTYGRNIVPCGPVLESANFSGGEAMLKFTNIGEGLEVRSYGLKRSIDDILSAELDWIELAGQDGIWHPAKAEFQDFGLIVSSPDVPDPKAVRYGCATMPQGNNLYNSEGLPASPFCTKLEWLPWQQQ